MILQDTRKWFYRNGDRQDLHTATYKIHIENGRIQKIQNGFGHLVEKNSECWEYYNKKYLGGIPASA